MAADLNEQRARRELTAAPAAEPAAGCGARDLKGLLDQIAAQIGDADRRHSTALRDMQSRLTGLSQTAASARATATADARPAIDRIEGEISALASRVAAADRELSMSAAPEPAEDLWSTADAEALASIYDPVAAPAPVPASVEAQPDAAPAEETVALPPVASILPRGPIADLAPEAADEIDASPVARDELTLAPLSAVLPSEPLPVLDVPAPAAVVAEAPAAVAQPEPALAADRSWLDERLAAVAERVEQQLARGKAQEQDWLEGRLAEVASRIEQQLAVLRPDSSLLQLSEHIDQVEKRLGATLAGTARRTDVEGLAALETQIAALASQLGRTERHLARLDAVETEIRQLSTRVSDERLAAMLIPQQTGSPALAEADLDRIARAVAGMVQGPTPAAAVDATQVAEIRGLLETVMAEQRQADEQTASVLDTMQHALIGLLDRMDAIEQQPLEPAAYAPSYQPAPAHAPAAFAPMPVDQPAAPPVVEPPHVSLEDYVPESARAPEIEPEPVRTTFRREAAVAAPVIEDIVETPAPAVVEPAVAAPTAEKAAPRKDEPAGRDEFIAAARRAMRQAQAKAAAEEAERAAAEPAQKGATRALRKNILSGLGRGGSSTATVLDEQPAAEAPAGAKVDRRVVVAAIAALMIAGAGYQYYRMQTSAVPSPIASTKIERQLVTPQTIERERAEAQAQGQPKDASRPAAAQAQSPTRTPAPAADRTGPGTQPAAPETATGKRGQRPLPEALVDELSDRQEQTAPQKPEQRDARLDMPPDLLVPGAGITIQQSPGTPTPYEIRRYHDRQTLARLSNQLSRISNPGMPIVAAVPAAEVAEESRIEGEVIEAPLASATPPAGTGATASTGVSQPAGQVISARAGEMPPASAGPMSLRLAAQAGDPSAEFEVAARMAEGRGMPQDFKQAVVWYERSATRGFAAAQYRLASMYERGLGTAADLDAAKLWYKRAADQGHVKAMHNLAVLIAGTTSGAPDYPAAAQWFQLAADYGLGDSQFNLAVLYESGLGVQRDMRLAYKWLSLSARAGDAQAAKRKALVRTKIDAGDAAKIDEEVEAWRARSSSRLINDARAAGEAWKVRAGQQQAVSG